MTSPTKAQLLEMLRLRDDELAKLRASVVKRASAVRAGNAQAAELRSRLADSEGRAAHLADKLTRLGAELVRAQAAVSSTTLEVQAMANRMAATFDSCRHIAGQCINALQISRDIASGGVVFGVDPAKVDADVAGLIEQLKQLRRSMAAWPPATAAPPSPPL